MFFECVIICITKSHNPYFNRWFSAIELINSEIFNIRNVTILILIDGFLQYRTNKPVGFFKNRHNPYFNRWFSAIYYPYIRVNWYKGVTILILIDGFLQCIATDITFNIS